MISPTCQYSSWDLNSLRTELNLRLLQHQLGTPKKEDEKKRVTMNYITLPKMAHGSNIRIDVSDMAYVST